MLIPNSVKLFYKYMCFAFRKLVVFGIKLLRNALKSLEARADFIDTMFSITKAGQIKTNIKLSATLPKEAVDKNHDEPNRLCKCGMK